MILFYHQPNRNAAVNIFLLREKIMSDEIILTDANFEEEVIKSELPVLVDFWAEWCGPCKMFAPTIEELATEFKGRAKIAKLNVDQNPAVAEKFGIRGIPTVILFHDGNVAEQAVGVQSKTNLIKMLERKAS
jgi:thioredoxin 1